MLAGGRRVLVVRSPAPCTALVLQTATKLQQSSPKLHVQQPSVINGWPSLLLRKPDGSAMLGTEPDTSSGSQPQRSTGATPAIFGNAASAGSASGRVSDRIVLPGVRVSAWNHTAHRFPSSSSSSSSVFSSTSPSQSTTMLLSKSALATAPRTPIESFARNAIAHIQLTWRRGGVPIVMASREMDEALQQALEHVEQASSSAASSLSDSESNSAQTGALQRLESNTTPSGDANATNMSRQSASSTKLDYRVVSLSALLDMYHLASDLHIEQMIHSGLLQEATTILKSYPDEAAARHLLGYRQAIGYISHEWLSPRSVSAERATQQFFRFLRKAMKDGRLAVDAQLEIDNQDPETGGLWLPRTAVESDTAAQLAELATIPRAEFEERRDLSRIHRVKPSTTSPAAPRRYADVAQVFHQLQRLAVGVKTAFPPPAHTPRLVGQLWHVTRT
ncbi:hypothetical protein CAOG_02216 [Capsaspora owczarzaki ATCC 30864]|uniref:Uncharacterized protein n=1 Tax=Capsaspora owczarzaki (strain ATCC 30864) TaxID=595528 RepID=A0A0D2VLL2_CAPO3|nr:hypothetical protein CAOG_02216 [Capsaspora owczarzaki ATCC 30864]KJE91012.1 hypothetical protein CAOG_002216 [Capsaspora owczarzaki ATCC 30864]|eukprot:XP_004348966.1 hypothetical protein CAOG_02216 [Capsaspora owczarzaki ATCC 30864]